MTTKWIVALIASLTLWLVPRGADAQPTSRAERARTHYVDGITLQRSGDLVGAARELRTAYALIDHPQIAFDLGLVFAELDDPVRATQMMKAALRGRTRLDQDTVKRARTVIDELEPAISVVIIETPVRGARIRVNGRDVGKAPLGKPASVRAGVIDIEVVAAGRAPEFTTLTIKPGFQQSVELPLEAAGSRAPLQFDTGLHGAEFLVAG
ncbi:MAG: PEGA domain-containing protein, partial [Polyangiaceae bacterium]